MATTITLAARYELTQATREALALAGTPTARYQVVEFELDAADALKRKLARVDDDGQIRQNVGGGTEYGGPIGQINPLAAGRGGATGKGIWNADHVLTPEEARARCEQAWAEWCVYTETERRKQEEAAAAKRALIERAVELLRSIPAGQWVIGTYGNDVTPNPGPGHIDVQRSDLPQDLRNAVSEEETRRKREKDAKKNAAEAAKAAERDAWIKANGSPRLQKGLAAGMIDKLASVYQAERIAHDLGPDWHNWQTAAEPNSNDRLNPAEAELDALADAREKFDATAVLKSVGGEDKRGDFHGWRPVVMVSCPWDKEETAIKYLDATK